MFRNSRGIGRERCDGRHILEANPVEYTNGPKL